MLRRRVSSSSESILSSSTQQSSEGVIKPSVQNGGAQAPLSPSPASMQSQVRRMRWWWWWWSLSWIHKDSNTHPSDCGRVGDNKTITSLCPSIQKANKHCWKCCAHVFHNIWMNFYHIWQKVHFLSLKLTKLRYLCMYAFTYVLLTYPITEVCHTQKHVESV